MSAIGHNARTMEYIKAPTNTTPMAIRVFGAHTPGPCGRPRGSLGPEGLGAPPPFET